MYIWKTQDILLQWALEGGRVLRSEQIGYQDKIFWFLASSKQFPTKYKFGEKVPKIKKC